jgi:hypothetical protein
VLYKITELWVALSAALQKLLAKALQSARFALISLSIEDGDTKFRAHEGPSVPSEGTETKFFSDLGSLF